MSLKGKRYGNVKCETRHMLKILFLISQISLSHILAGQSKVMDSLKLALKNATHDTTRCNILNAMIEAENNDTIWPKYNEQLMSLAEKNAKADRPQKKFYLKHLAISLNNIGFISDNLGDIGKALEYYGRSLKTREKIGDKKGVAKTLNNIGVIYKNQGDIGKALTYYGKSLKIREEIGDKKGIALSLNNIGVIIKNQGDIENALNYYVRSLKIREELGDKQGIAVSLNNIGIIFKHRGDSWKALEYYERSLKIWEETRDKQGIAFCLINIGDIYLKQENYPKALESTTKSLILSRGLGYPENIQNAAQLLTDIYEKTNQPAKALEMFKLYVQMRDSVVNRENRKKTIQQQFKYEYEKKSAADSVAFAKSQEIKTAEIAKQKAEITAKRNQQYFLFGGWHL